MAAKIHERFETQVGLEEARRRFVNRVRNVVFSSTCYDHRTIRIKIAYKLGDEYRSPQLMEIIGEDCYWNLQAFEAIYETVGSNDHQFEAEIHRLLPDSEVDLGIRWEKGQFVKSAGALLDERLVNDPLHWIRPPGNETVLLPFEKALRHFLHASQHPEFLADVITDMHESLEALAKIVTDRPNKDLSGNQQLFLSDVNNHPDPRQYALQALQIAPVRRTTA